MAEPPASYWVHVIRSPPERGSSCTPQSTPRCNVWERLRACRGVLAHSTPNKSLLVLSKDACPPLMAFTFLMMFLETEEVQPLVLLLICFAMLQAREHRAVDIDTKGRMRGKSFPQLMVWIPTLGLTSPDVQVDLPPFSLCHQPFISVLIDA